LGILDMFILDLMISWLQRFHLSVLLCVVSLAWSSKFSEADLLLPSPSRPKIGAFFSLGFTAIISWISATSLPASRPRAVGKREKGSTVCLACFFVCVGSCQYIQLCMGLSGLELQLLLPCGRARVYISCPQNK
jgi:hypothetical protein